MAILLYHSLETMYMHYSLSWAV